MNPSDAIRDPGIDKPFDRMLKDFAREAPQLLLQTLGIAPIGSNVVVQPLNLEVAPTVKQVDYVAFVMGEGQTPYVFHAEFIVNFTAESPGEMTEYGVRLALMYKQPIRSLAVLLNPERAPLVIPEFGELVYGDTRMSHSYRVVLIWQVDPGPLLAAGDLRVLPWAVLMKSTDEQVRQIGATLGQSGDEEAISRFLTLGSIRYDRSELEAMLGGGHMGFVEAFMEASSVVRDIRKKAEDQGRNEGRNEVRAEIAAVLKSFLGARFPGLEAMAGLDAVPAVELSPLFSRIVALDSREDVVLAIASATQPSSNN